MRNKYFSRNFATALLSLAFTGCLSIRPSAVKAGKHLYETFLSGSGKTIYFLKPLHFKGKHQDGSVDMDFTFGYSNVSSDTVSVKFSVTDEQVLKSVDSMRIVSGTTSVLFKPMKHMFSDRGQGNYINRFSTETGLDNLKHLFESTDWQISLYTSGQSLTYTSGGKTDKQIEKLKQYVFTVL